MAKGGPDDMPVRAAGPAGGGVSALADAARLASEGNAIPPVHLWDPPFCGDIDVVIRRDGTWHHEGSPIGRPALVRLFASILRREGDDHFLVTPVEKMRITVEDAPFLAVDVEPADGRLTFLTNVGDRVEAGPEHAIRLEHHDGEPAPYLHVRRGLEARIDRKTFYRLADLGEAEVHEGAEWFGVRSNDAFFPMIPAAELER